MSFLPCQHSAFIAAPRSGRVRGPASAVPSAASRECRRRRWKPARAAAKAARIRAAAGTDSRGASRLPRRPWREPSELPWSRCGSLSPMKAAPAFSAAPSRDANSEGTGPAHRRGRVMPTTPTCDAMPTAAAAAESPARPARTSSITRPSCSRVASPSGWPRRIARIVTASCASPRHRASSAGCARRSIRRWQRPCPTRSTRTCCSSTGAS